MNRNGYLILIKVVVVVLLFSSCDKKAENSTATVHLKKNGDSYELYRNGEVFHIKGASASSYFKELKAAGANTVRVYDTTNLGVRLDSAFFYQLAVIVDLPITRYYNNDSLFMDQKFMDNELNSLKVTVKKYKNHPAILYWILGNEINYPDQPIDNKYIKHFNNLVNQVQNIDVDHPVSTAVGGFNRSKIINIKNFSPKIDFISINIFGELSTFSERKNAISWLWNGPYIFSEFGVNGQWEAYKTKWGAPVEETSTKKAEQYQTRYTNYIETLNDGRLLGTLFFYWGVKQERTHTWFNTLDDDGKKNESAFVFEEIWKGQNKSFYGPKINYLLMNDKGAKDNIVAKAGDIAKMDLLMEEGQNLDSLSVRWELRKENWNYLYNQVEKRPELLMDSLVLKNKEKFKFRIPQLEGPYRIFLFLENKDVFATANIPFYVFE